TLVLHNPGGDYMRGFELWHGKREAPLVRIGTDDPVDAKYPDGRIAPVSRLAKIFFDAIERGGIAAPGFAEGYRVQQLIDTARRAHLQGVWIDVARETAKEEMRACAASGSPEAAGSSAPDLSKRWSERAIASACSTTIHAATPAGSPGVPMILNSWGATSAMQPPLKKRRSPSMRFITSPSSTALNFSTASRTWCSMSACAA